jgi:quinol monooxygenase YgiN
MDDLFGMHVEFTAKPGFGNDLEAVLLEASVGLREVYECRLYMISRSAVDPDSVFVTEAWTSREVHAESLNDPAARALIERAMPLLACVPRPTELRPVGGKGL